MSPVNSMCSACDQNQPFIRVPVDSMLQAFQNRLQCIRSIRPLTTQHAIRINTKPMVPPNVYNNINGTSPYILLPLEDDASSDDKSMPPSEPRNERTVIRIPGRDDPRRGATQQRARHIHRTPPPDHTEAETPVPTNIMGGEDDEAPQYVGRIRQYPGRSTRYGLVREAGGGGALFSFVAFTSNEPPFNTTQSTSDSRTIGKALTGPDADEWSATMDTDIGNLRSLHVLVTVASPIYKNFITPKWVFHRKFENGALVKHKARLVARGFTQVPGIDYNEAHLYGSVMRPESFRSLVSIAALFDLDLRQFDVSAA